MSLWIVIPGWEKFQHYADREPIWLRHYVDQLDRDEYLELSAGARSLLHDVRLLYARRRFQVPASPSWLHKMTGLRVKPSHLEELNHAGFIQLVASKPIRRPRITRALARGEENRNPPTPLRGKTPNPNGAPKEPSPYAHHHGPSPKAARKWIDNGAALEIPEAALRRTIADEFKITDPAVLDELVDRAGEAKERLTQK